VAGGIFNVQLDFGLTALAGDDRYLAISVRCPAGSGAYTALTPRQAITPAPYATYATRAPWSGIQSIPAGFGDNIDNDVVGGLTCTNGQVAQFNGTAWVCAAAGGTGDITGVTAGTGLTGGGASGAVTLNVDPTVVQSRVSATCAAGSSIRVIAQNGTVTCETDDTGGAFWSLTGNSGTNPSTQFIGTTDNVALEFRVNNLRVFRIEPNDLSPNIIGGLASNTVTVGVLGATISGGGEGGLTNRVTDEYGTIGGGLDNQAGDNAGTTSDGSYATVSGGYTNTASGDASTVGGGYSNEATAGSSTVGGGYDNTASGTAAFVGGGSNNQATGTRATIGGGYDNTVTADSATVAGGYDNTASGNYATVGGGWLNVAGNIATVGGGYNNAASGDTATVSGGSNNAASGYYATVGGGLSNVAGNIATVGGGYNNAASGDTATVAGGWNNIASGTAAFVRRLWQHRQRELQFCCRNPRPSG